MIDTVEVLGAPRSGPFQLRILGRGLAPGGVRFDLSGASGEADIVMRAQVLDTGNRQRVDIARDALEIKSPQEVMAQVSTALPAGVYGLALMLGEDTEPFVQRRAAFEVKETDIADAGQPLDADPSLDGAVVTPDSGVPPPDSGVPPPPDSGVPAPPDGGVAPDAAPPPDAGRQDSGNGPFVADYQYRQAVDILNPSNGSAPQGVTAVVPINHADMVAAGARADGNDVALYADTQVLLHVWQDPRKLGSNDLKMIVALPAAIASLQSARYLLYWKSATAQSPVDERVYSHIEHFTALSGWQLRNWTACAYDYLIDGPAGSNGAYCSNDLGNANPERRTLASPELNVPQLAQNLTYVVSMWLNGSMGLSDAMYFAEGPDQNDFANAFLIPTGSWSAYPPNLLGFTFLETTGNNRTVDAWRLPAGNTTWFRAEATWRPNYTTPSFHYRYLSVDNAQTATNVIIDELSFRVTTAPALGVTVDPTVETP